MKNILIFLTIILLSCGSNDASSDKGKTDREVLQTTDNKRKPEKQLNLTILLDLSDRIDSIINPDQPQHFQRDTALINHLTRYFTAEIASKGTYMAKGKMRIVFHPNPADPNINEAATKLTVDLSQMETKLKKVVYSTFDSIVNLNIGHIYATTLKQAKWPGSDIWRFFKNDVKDVAIDRDTNYRNILVVFTDGYIYHADSKEKTSNRYAYILPETLERYKLRGSVDNAKQKIQQFDFGLIAKRSDLQDLEVLVLEVTPSKGHKDDEDIIRIVLNKWFTEMKVKKWKVLNSDLPTNTLRKVDDFLNF